MGRRLRKRNKRRVRVVVLTTIMVLGVLTTAYAAFSTSITLTAKGTIVETPVSAATLIKQEVVTDGDGLYADPTETNRYVFSGSDSYNYITFNNEMWRVMSVEADNTIKIIKEESIGDTLEWDSNDGLDWSAASLKTYLNGTYYSSLSTAAKNQIASHEFNVGSVTTNAGSGVDKTVAAIYTEEKIDTWTGNVGIMNLSDAIKTSSNHNNCWFMKDINQTGSGINFGDAVCGTESYLNVFSNFLEAFTINVEEDEEAVWVIGDPSFTGGGTITTDYHPSDTGLVIYPVVYLKSTTMLTGHGTQSNPYVIH